MNKKIALSTIAMFAVTLGLGVLSPALADKPQGDEHRIEVCHFSEAYSTFNATGQNETTSFTAGMTLIEIDNMGQFNGHFKKSMDEPRHGNSTLGLYDFVINATAGSGQEASDCLPAVTNSTVFP
ncbi:MAG: hypothetical protein PVH93_05585 [Nitrosopumilaceae archaeon]|jgi:hypothetical protein